MCTMFAGAPTQLLIYEPLLQFKRNNLGSWPQAASNTERNQKEKYNNLQNNDVHTVVDKVSTTFLARH